LIAKLRTAVHVIFGPSYPEITDDLWSNPGERGNSQVCQQLYMSQVSGRQMFEPLLAPIIYAQGTTDADGIFQNEVLFSVCLIVFNSFI
jgi:hypothetical protein